MTGYTARAFALEIRANTAIRFTPDHHDRTALPSPPVAGTCVPISTSRGDIEALVVTSRPDTVEIEAEGSTWRLRPLKPSEAGFAPGWVEGRGSTDWIVSHGTSAKGV